MQAEAKARVSRINAMLPTKALEQLRAKAYEQGTTVSELLRYAIGLAEYLEHVRKQGGRILIHWKNGDATEILPRIPSADVYASSAPSANVSSTNGSAATEATVAEDKPILEPGTSSPLVSVVQTALKLYARDQDPSADPGEIDGWFGPQTESAVRAFQERNGVTPDGIVRGMTWQVPAVEGTPLAAMAGLEPV